MIRKTVLGLAAVVALATAAFAPTSASAGYYGYGYGYKSHYKPYYGYTHYRPYCFTKKVWTYYGWDWVRVCR